MAELTTWASKLLMILGVLIVGWAVYRYRAHRRKLERQRKAVWQRHQEWQNGASGHDQA